MRLFRRNDVSVTEVRPALDAGAAFIDVRTADEWKQGRAVGAIHMPPQKLAGRLDEYRDQIVLVICRSGSRSGTVAAALRREGIDARNVKGGMLSWERHGLPTTRKGRR